MRVAETEGDVADRGGVGRLVAYISRGMVEMPNRRNRVGSRF